MGRLVHYLEEIGARSALHSLSSLDVYHQLSDSPYLTVYTEADLVRLARAFDDLQFPGREGVDAVLRRPEGGISFRCVDSLKKPPPQSFRILNFLYDPAAMTYLDPYDCYRDVRAGAFSHGGDESAFPPHSWKAVADAAALLSRYRMDASGIDALAGGERVMSRREALQDVRDEMDVADQRMLLVELLRGKNPKAGFQLLRWSGFILRHWPELVAMYDVSHTKDHHPEGDAWQHTLETFGHRKVADLTLSLGLLFHDAGKPFAAKSEGRMFDGHSQIGARIAARFLERLGFEEPLVRDVSFLVREHMLPSFVHELPTFRTERVMSSQLFPLLLELYRCDLSSTYRGPTGYYRACKVYREYLKNVRNPFRTADGKKIVRMFVERP